MLPPASLGTGRRPVRWGRQHRQVGAGVDGHGQTVKFSPGISGIRGRLDLIDVHGRDEDVIEIIDSTPLATKNMAGRIAAVRLQHPVYDRGEQVLLVNDGITAKNTTAAP